MLDALRQVAPDGGIQPAGNRLQQFELTTGPSSTAVSVSTIAVAATSVTTGGTLQGTVTLNAAATAAMQLSLASSNPSVLTVPATVDVAMGSTSAAFSATAAGAGSASITATLNGSSRQSQTITVLVTAVSLRSITLATPSAVGGDVVTGTVSLTANAPAGGVLVQLSSGDPISVPASVSVLAGQSSVAFTAVTRSVNASVTGTITAAYGGVNVSTTLSVTRPGGATANFGVTGPNVTETCLLADAGATLNCIFDGSTSTAPGTITSWEWTYGVTTTRSQTTSGAVLTRPLFSCSMIPSPPLPSGAAFINLVVTLVVRDGLGNVSNVSVHDDVRLLPQGSCGY